MNVKLIFDFFIHLDKYLRYFIDSFGIFTYIILFFVIFLETGFVITPFLPGDSILFAVGTFSAMGLFKLFPVYILLLSAAVLGDTVNYWIGHSIGPKIFVKESRFIKKEYLERTKSFYEKHGGKTIILARFIPIIRTFAPFIAGIGVMKYSKFLLYNVLGGFLWVSLFIFLGYFFGNIPIVKDNFELTIFIIILISVAPVVLEFIKSKFGSKKINS
jgi:membrane-associated protein